MGFGGVGGLWGSSLSNMWMDGENDRVWKSEWMCRVILCNSDSDHDFIGSAIIALDSST